MSEELAPAVDPIGLAKYFAEFHPSFTGEFTVERLGGGQSCLTFMVAADGWEVVLRRPPRGDLPPTAFDVRREYRVMKALHDAGSDVPVPQPLSLCTDQAVIGADFYLMATVPGLVIRTELPQVLDGERAAMSQALVDTLVSLQRVDYRSIGLEGFGKPEGYLARQMERMRQLWALAKFRDIPEIDEVGAWLEANIPSARAPAIVHGDFKLDNVIFADRAPAKLLAVVDWEMSTIGDPLADVGWMLYFWRDPGDEWFGLAVASVTDKEGFLRRADLLERYASTTGSDVSTVNWYAALAGWKIAIIMEGSYRRFLAGVTDHPTFAMLEQGVPVLAKRAALAMRDQL